MNLAEIILTKETVFFTQRTRSIIITNRIQEKPEFLGYEMEHQGFYCLARNNDWFVRTKFGVQKRGSCKNYQDGMKQIADFLNVDFSVKG